mmetsp:Transcript_31454/g.51411  ORF Transcript_31454/g.51411 Transcript_31454/m.51411 type:complete len:153 (-) Transcript_31454:724-1182(-)
MVNRHVMLLNTTISEQSVLSEFTQLHAAAAAHCSFYAASGPLTDDALDGFDEDLCSKSLATDAFPEPLLAFAFNNFEESLRLATAAESLPSAADALATSVLDHLEDDLRGCSPVASTPARAAFLLGFASGGFGGFGRGPKEQNCVYAPGPGV